ncbi:MAG: DUF2326 domain-containing protein [Acholeplasmatales bacterium]|nr:DUF2326 domain-containing protein [Acholeplasmatales bacterium]
MLKEIRSNAFISNGNIRPTIVFNEGLNVCKGPDDYPNSIGKSDFLMAIDFAFGGNDYVEKLDDVLRHVDQHEICFAFEFENKITRFSRSTENKDIVYICNENYEKQGDPITLTAFTNWLKEKYLIKNQLTFRGIVNRYFRVYGRENDDETLPLRSAKSEPLSTSIISLIKLFDLYKVIEKDIEAEKEANEKKSAFSKAQDYQYIPKINKTEYKNNLKQIEELKQKKTELAEKAGKNLLELDSEKAAAIAKLKGDLKTFKRQRGKYYNQLDSIKKNREIESSSIQNDFSALQEFFPNAELSIERLQQIEAFHKDLTTILKNDFKEAEKKVWNLINLLNIQIENIEKEINSIEQVEGISKIILEEYAKIEKEIIQLEEQNKRYDQNETLVKEHKEKVDTLTDNQMTQEKILEKKLNDEMANINKQIFGINKNSPTIHFDSIKSYTFSTFDDHGTGTNFKGFIIFDLANLSLTELPCLVHDSYLFKNIGKDTIQKIIEIYTESKHQIFISIDNVNNYHLETQKIINDNVVIELSPNGNELYGQKW